MGSSVSTASNATVSAKGEVVVVAGASQGIGRGVAARFARAGAEVWIVVRSLAKGNEVLEELKRVAPAGTPAPRVFLADLNVKADILRAADEIKAAAGERGVAYLIQTQGGPANPKFIAPNADGLDTHFAVQVFSRVLLAHELRHVVTRSSMAIAVAGIGKKQFDRDDITLEALKARGAYGFLRTGARNCTVIDAAWIELAKDSPAQYTHLFPGFVRTNVLANAQLSPLLVWATWLFGFVLGRTIEQYAEIPFYLTANPDGRKLVEREGGWWNDKFKRLAPSPALKDSANQSFIWDWLQARIAR